MTSNRSRSTFELIPVAWFDPVVGLWVTLLAVLGVHLTFAGARALLQPPDPVAWIAPLGTAFVTAFAYGVFAFGLTRVYRAGRGLDPRPVLAPLNRAERRWIGGLVIAALVVMALGGVWSNLVGYHADLAAPTIAVGSPPLLADGFPVDLGIGGANTVLNSLPFVAFWALLVGLLAGPAVGAVFHGVLQDTLARGSSPGVAVVGTATVTAVVLQNSAFVSTTTMHEALGAVAVFAFALGVAYAYRETESLPVAMAAYGVFNVLGLALGWFSLAARLHAKGLLFG